MSRLGPSRWYVIRLFAVLTLALGACGAETSQTDASTPGGGIGVFDGSWALSDETLSDEALPGSDISNEERLILLEVIDDTSTLTVHTNCNRRFGSYTFTSDGSASISLPGATKKACDHAANALEQTTVALLESITRWTLEGTSLSLTGPHQTLIFHPIG